MFTTVEGTYRAGKIVLNEQPAAQEGSRVLVTFLVATQTQPSAPKMIQFGMSRTEGGRETTWEDFQEAKHALHKRVEDENAA